MLHWRLRYTMTGKQADAAIDVFSLTTCEVLQHAAPFFCIRQVYHKTLIP